MFEGKALEAMNFYVGLFPNARVLELRAYGPNEPGPEGSVKVAKFNIGDEIVMCSDSYVHHEFTFTPSISLFVTSNTEDEIDHLFAELSAGGQTFMPLGDYGFSRKFGWVQDRFGVSWQLSLA
jgi:predicted 3-demethylubiquinone-9 3-methyltransferase (glyoxalase superfamily)